MVAIERRFEQVCESHADLTAVVSGKRVLTYGGLNARANQLARMILDRIGDNDGTVGLQLEHGASLCLGVLACLKAGKVYVPLDPNNPAERQRIILADAGATLLLTDGTPEYTPPHGGFLDLNEIRRDTPDTNLNRPPRDDDCAFLLYTSGSTGRPKGVVYLHRTVVARIADFNRFGVGPGDRLTALGSGGMNLLRALLTGATLVSFNLREVEVGALSDWMKSNRITIYHSVPTVLRRFVSTLSGRLTLPDLRIVNITGETLLSSDVAAFRRHFPERCVLVNGLGTTETGTFRELRIDHGTEVREGVVPVGHAIEGVEVVLLDPAGQVLGQGQVGEIVVCGEHLSPGYWKQPGLTAERFVHVDGRRAYRTGDLGEWLAGRSLLHLGRMDFQVKIRGHRVEVGEVEIALVQHPAVKEAAVVGERDAEGRTPRLLGYVTLHAGQEVNGTALQTFLRERVPDFMLPAIVLVLPRLPQTPNGKVDRLALPKPEPAAAENSREAQAPLSPVEAELLRIWQAAFGKNNLTLEANFFELGGDSLSAVRILFGMHAAFGIEKSIRVIFENPSLAVLAEVVRREVECVDL